jgi:predicted ATP-grasp superfamily ATP-dependent carboligase
MSSLKNTLAVIVAQDGPNPLGIARGLGKEGVPVCVLTSSKKTPLINCSRYIKKIVRVPSFDDIDIVRKKLLEICHQLGNPDEKPVLIFTNESHYLRFFPLADFFNENFFEMTPIVKAVFYAEKKNQFSAAEKAGFTVLPTFSLKTSDDLPMFESLVFPLLVRPSVPHCAGNFTEKTMLFSDFTSFKKSLTPILADSDADLIVQEYVPGEDRDVLFFMASCDKTGEPRAWICGRKKRQYPPGRGLMASGILESIPDFEEKSKSLCRLFGLQGFIGIECKQHPHTKEFVYIESSIRSEATNAICFSAGMNLMFDAYQIARGGRCNIVQKKELRGSWVSFQLDYDAAKILLAEGKMTWKEFMKPLPYPTTYAIFAWDDPFPFLKSLTLAVLGKMKRLFQNNQV